VILALEVPRMKLLVFILNQEELLEEVLEAYIEAGISGATIVDSEGMGHFLANEVPLFADFKDFMKGNKPGNKTILSIVTDGTIVSELKRILDDVMGGLEQPGSGIMFTVPVDWVSGFPKVEGKREDSKA
jgi:nitrogen regulatory protein PII